MIPGDYPRNREGKGPDGLREDGRMLVPRMG